MFILPLEDLTSIGPQELEAFVFLDFKKILNRPVTRILCGGVLTRPKWTKLPKCIFYCLIRLFRKVAIHEKL